MNDRFKFRAWEKIEKRMINGEYWLLASNGEVYEYSMGKLSKNSNYALMQCTGLKDKNGKLIFEGDIIQRIDELGWTTKQEIPLQMVNNCGDCGYVWGWGVPTDEAGMAAECEIIGNIFENPTILTK